MMCISLFSYGRPVVVRCMGVPLGMGWVGSMKIDPCTNNSAQAAGDRITWRRTGHESPIVVWIRADGLRKADDHTHPVYTRPAGVWSIYLFTSYAHGVQVGKLSEDGTRSAKRERGRGQLFRRHQSRIQRPSHDHTRRSKESPAEPCTSGRFTSFLVADILGIGNCSSASGDLEPVTSSDQQPQRRPDDFSVERFLLSDDRKTSPGIYDGRCTLILHMLLDNLLFCYMFFSAVTHSWMPGGMSSGLL